MTRTFELSLTITVNGEPMLSRDVSLSIDGEARLKAENVRETLNVMANVLLYEALSDTELEKAVNYRREE